MFGFDRQEMKIFRKLNSPKKIQDFLETIPINFEENGDTYMSPRRVLRENKAHCVEGAMLAAAALWLHGQKPLLLNLRTADPDEDHAVALFRYKGHWGAVSKTNHAVLRYREPVYKTLRELALSYFHEYFLDNGRKTMRGFSKPLDLSKPKWRGWTIAEKDLWGIDSALDGLPHTMILTSAIKKSLRRADPIEIKAGKIVQWKPRKT